MNPAVVYVAVLVGSVALVWAVIGAARLIRRMQHDPDAEWNG